MRSALLVSLLLVLGLAPPAEAAPQSWKLTNGDVAATVTLHDNGTLSLIVAKGATTVLNPSALGIRTSAADLSTGLAFAGRTDRRVQETYATASGRRKQHQVDANETTLRFTKGAEKLDVVFRVSADGLGYRYVLGKSATVTGEASEYAVPPSARAVLLPWDNGRQDYENIHVHTTVGAAQQVAYGYPSLFQVDGTWLLVTESDMTGNYGASRITLSGGKFRVTLPDANTASNGTTPWRVLIVGDLPTVVESDLSTDLASPSKIGDMSWVKPGTSAWSWWGDGTGDLALQKRYVDYAAKQGWEYILVDSGWKTWSASQVQELIRYGTARKVGVQLWVHYSDLDTASERDSKLPLWHSWGAAGLKIDFMNSDSQARMKWYDAILAATAKNKLLVNFHGSTVPRGTERTWPHVMSFEAVRGAEGIKPKPGKVPYPVSHYLTLPFTRNLAGSMDFTPVTFSAVRDNSEAAELALSVVFESGLQNFADKIANYPKYPIAERLLKTVPAAWDDTKLLEGDPGKLAVFARRSGAEWYVGANVAGAARTLDVPLAFLGSGTWQAEIFNDNADRKLTFSTRTVTAGGTLSLPVARDGGFTVRFVQPARP
ncbi:glycoside hydrolase family 97 protein [Lentzea tibetensis]|uniref:Glycoside hydrolase family 97 protein n=1 Tax=Lentzea tibetensis TaxID=2591470 RepID=A0A563EHM7_9PSEU|nr:glycoside hydrolase family 97 protein [Lentzea tibetensis]TWP46129.1 glycoside hydrolase family 97 protein [Lentzea tibetensis]